MDADKSLKRILIEVAREREDRPPYRREGHKHLACGKLCIFDYFNPSAMGQCERRVILSHAGVQGKGLSDDDVMFFWMGDIIHDAVQYGIAKKLTGQVWNEVGMRDDTYHISGRLDTLRLVLDEGEWGVYEYKTVRSDAFRFKVLKEGHILQVLLYQVFPIDCPVCRGYESLEPKCVMCQNTGMVGPASWGKIAYMSRDGDNLEVYDIVIDDEMKAAVKQKLMRLQVFAEEFERTGVLPEKLQKEAILDKKGEPEIYQKSSTKFGFKKGDPKLKDDYRVRNCPYLGSGRCCGDKEAK